MCRLQYLFNLPEHDSTGARGFCGFKIANGKVPSEGLGTLPLKEGKGDAFQFEGGGGIEGVPSGITAYLPPQPPEPSPPSAAAAASSADFSGWAMVASFTSSGVTLSGTAARAAAVAREV